MRTGTKAKAERQKRALARFTMHKQGDNFPKTNRPRFANEDAFAVYFARKNREKSSLQVAIRNLA